MPSNYQFAGDGITDDSPAMQAALDSIYADGGGSGVVAIPDGVTRLSSLAYKNFDEGRSKRNGNLLFQGSGERSRVLLTDIGPDGALHIDNANTVVFRDLFFEGATENGNSTPDRDFVAKALQFGSVNRVIFENCVLAGLGSDALGPRTGVVVISDGILTLDRCDIGGSTVPFGGVFSLDRCYGLNVNECRFIDYYQAHGNMYNKLTMYGAAKSWIKESDPLTGPRNAMQTAHSITNCIIDEGCTGAALDLAGGRELVMRNNTHNGGLYFGDAKALKATGFRKVTIENYWIGYRDGDHWESMEFADCGCVELNNVEHTESARWLTLSGSTERLDLRFCSLQGNEQFPTGINNAAGAVITNFV